MIRFIKSVSWLFILPSFFCSIILAFTITSHFLASLLVFSFLIIYYKFLLKHKILNDSYLKSFFYLFAFINLILCILFIITEGNINSLSFNLFYILIFPYFPLVFFSALMGILPNTILWIEVVFIMQLVICFYLVKPKVSVKTIAIICTTFLLACSSNIYFYNNRPEAKYSGHGFDYMNGFSSTDLSDYYPYANNSKLVTLKEPSTFIIENEKDMPILDGAEACYPVYSAIAKAVYKDIDKIEETAKDSKDSSSNGKIVTFTNTSVGYSRLFQKDCDMFFGAKPSQVQLEEAKTLNVELEYTPIGKEGFVFFVNKDNPIDTLTTDQVKAIYHGDITNWKEVGGKDEEITAFQRPERSGSQSMMMHFMGDISLKEPMTFEMQAAMGGIIKEVAQYHNESGAIGYTFRYFLEGLNQEKDVKIISIDGIKPSTENIKNQSYPISTYLYCVTLKSNQNENVKKLRDYLLSNQGQYIIEQTGYCSLK
ncbi:MAG: substrate-binding domain-containing protein [Coprobacillus sp.]